MHYFPSPYALGPKEESFPLLLGCSLPGSLNPVHSSIKSPFKKSFRGPDPVPWQM